jgi:hypothetical protein
MNRLVKRSMVTVSVMCGVLVGGVGMAYASGVPVFNYVYPAIGQGQPYQAENSNLSLLWSLATDAEKQDAIANPTVTHPFDPYGIDNGPTVTWTLVSAWGVPAPGTVIQNPGFNQPLGFPNSQEAPFAANYGAITP